MRGRIFLVHWNAAEAEQLAAPLRAVGWSVETETEDGQRAWKQITADPPVAVVIFLTRLPSHGRETGRALRGAKATPNLPLLFVDGDEEAVAKTREKVPGARFVSVSELEGVLSELLG